MNITIKKWGNSQGIILPKPVLSSLGMDVDDDLNLEIRGNKIILSKMVDVDDYSDLILEDLINSGFKGQELLEEFRKVKKRLPNAAINMKEALLDEYKSGETVDYEELFNE